jgi:hypothetical protein
MAEVTQEITYWSADSLNAYANAEKNVEVGGNYFKITKLKASIIDGLDKLKTFDLIEQGLVLPKLEKNQIKNLPIDLAKDLATAILKFSGMDLETAEKN